MKDHMPGRAASTRNFVGVRELKAHAAGIVRREREARDSYVITQRGHAVGMILPLGTHEDVVAATGDHPTVAWDAFVRAGRRLEGRFRPA